VRHSLLGAREKLSYESCLADLSTSAAASPPIHDVGRSRSEIGEGVNAVGTPAVINSRCVSLLREKCRGLSDERVWLHNLARARRH